MASDKIVHPEQSETMTEDENQTLHVPAQPVVTFVAGDQTDIWPVTQRMLDAAVEKAYAGEREITWVEAGALSEETGEGLKASLAGIRLQQTTTLSSAMLSGAMLLATMGWDEASALVMKGVSGAIQAKTIPADAELQVGAATVAASEFVDVAIASMGVVEVSDVAVDHYDELADKFHEEFEAGAEKTAEFAQKAMETARKQLTAAGKFTEEQGHKLKEFLENDFSRVSQEVKAEARERLNPSRLGAGALASMSKILHKTGVVLSGFADKAEDALACKSGEITSAGKLTCNACGYEMNFKKTGRIPPCPKCHKTEFTKGY